MREKGTRTSGGARRPRSSGPVDPVAGLAGSIAHDFSNMLMVIRNTAGFLKDELPPDHPLQQRVATLIRTADRASRLTNQLQAFGRSQILRPELVRPAQLVRSMSDMLRHLVPEDVEFRISIRAPKAAVLFDPAQLQVVVVNLVTSAAEGIRTHGRLSLSVAEEALEEVEIAGEPVVSGQYVTINVTRTGEEIEEAEGHHTFRPRLTGKHRPRGTDLRLAGVHGVVTQSGGYVDVTNEQGRGTTFKLYLPLASTEEEGKRAELPVRVHRNVTGTEVILVVEDDAPVRMMVREMLERYGYTVYEASNGAEALHVTELFNTSPDLILTDLVMPGLTGRELIEGLAMEGSLPKVLLMSGYTDDEVLRRAQPAKEYPFIRKPFTHEELAAKVRRTLDS